MPPDKALVPKCTKATLVWSEQAPGTGTLQEMPLASTLQPTTLTSPAPPGMASAHCTRSPSSARRRPCLSIWFPHPNTSSLILYILSSLNGFSAFKKLSEKHRHSLEVKSQTSASHRIYDTLNLQLASAVAARSSLQRHWTMQRHSHLPGGSEQLMPRFLRCRRLNIHQWSQSKKNTINHNSHNSDASFLYPIWVSHPRTPATLASAPSLNHHTWNSSACFGRCHKFIPQICSAVSQTLRDLAFHLARSFGLQNGLANGPQNSN